MSDWLSRYAEELEKQLDGETSLEIAREDKNRLLDLARIVAHGTERKNAPLATFIVGRFVGAATAQGSDGSEAIAAALAGAEKLIDPLPDVEPG